MFSVPAERYDRFMGRYSQPLASQMIALGGVEPPARVVDVGCGPGALTSELVARFEAASVAAADPSEPFVAATRLRNADVDVRLAAAEDLPFPDDEFDAAFAQLVVHFMSDPVAGIAEMARVTRAGGAVVACVWDHVGGRSPLSVFWQAARDVHASTPSEATRPGTREGHLAEIFADAGLGDIVETVFTVRVEHETFDDWWEPYMYGVGPLGDFVEKLDGEGREAVRKRAAELLPEPPFVLEAHAWAVRGVA